MEFLYYFANNIPLFAISAVMLFIAFRNLRVRRKESVYFIVFTTIVLFLSVVCEMEKYSQREALVVVGTIFTSLGYITRPLLLYLFILLTNMDQKRTKVFYWVLFIPLVVNLVIYLLPLMFEVPGVSTVVFSYQLGVNEEGEQIAEFVRGGFLNFFSHAVCLFYLAVLVYVSMLRFNGKHRLDGLVIVLCVVIIIVTVVFEVVLSRNDLLNIVCEICAMINYIFILSVNASQDSLTNLYDRRTFEEDISKYHDSINGIIQIDMNELKFLNDHYGHAAGDAALNEIASIFKASSNPSSMCVYRLSGDEFVILMFSGKEEEFEDTVREIRKRMSKSDYTIALGSYFFDPQRVSFEKAMKQAEEFMYTDKGNYYRITGHDRRKV